MTAFDFMKDMKKRCKKHFARLGLRTTRLSFYESNGIHYINVGICMPPPTDICFDTDGLFHIDSKDTTIYHIHRGISEVEAKHLPDDDGFRELYFKEQIWNPIVEEIYKNGA
jgi:hypothetical protein